MIGRVLTHYGATVRPQSRHAWQAVKCPFHDDTTASASVNLQAGAFKCHACGVKGDAIKLVMEQEGLDNRASAESFIETIIGVSCEPIRTERKPRRVVPGSAQVLGDGRTRVPTRRGR